MPPWLSRSIMATAAVIAALAVAQWMACVFWIGPRERPAALGSEGAVVSVWAGSCNNVRSETVAVLMGLLTTLISLSRKSDD